MKLPNLKKMHELNTDKIFLMCFISTKITINPVLVNHNDPKACNILLHPKGIVIISYVKS